MPLNIFFYIKLVGVDPDGVARFLDLLLVLATLGILNPRDVLISTSYCAGSVNTLRVE